MGLGTTELIIIFGIVLLVFGANKIPKLAKGIGTGIREFKDSLSGKTDETQNSGKDDVKNVMDSEIKKESSSISNA